MSEKEVSEDAISKKLEDIIEDDFQNKTIRLFAKLIFNCRYDINELKLELLKVFKPEGEEKTMEEVNGSFYS